MNISETRIQHDAKTFKTLSLFISNYSELIDKREQANRVNLKAAYQHLYYLSKNGNQF